MTRSLVRAPASWLACALVIAASGCAERPDRPTPAARTIIPSTWTVEWQRGGTADDTLFRIPRRLATDGALVYVLDRYARRVVALRAEDGTVAWMAGARGRAPGQFDSPEALAGLPEGGVAVADPNNRRITLLDAHGALKAMVPIRSGSLVSSMCALDDGSLLLANVVGDAPLVRIARDGGVLDRPALPWDDLRGTASPRTQTVLGRAPDGGCVVALAQGPGFAAFDGRSVGPARDYVERFEPPREESPDTGMRKRPRVDKGTMAAIGVVARGDTVAVAFMGTSGQAGRLLDLYDRRTGAYLRSYAGPRIEEAAAAGDRLFILTQLDGHPAVLAQTIRPGDQRRP